MIGKKILLLVIALMATVWAVYATTKKGDIIEGFTSALPGFGFTVRSDLVMGGQNPGQFYSVPPTYQSILSPRFSALNDYGSLIRYNMPSMSMQGVPQNPLDYGNIVKENFGGGSKENYPTSCPGQNDSTYGGDSTQMGGYQGPNITNYGAGNYNEVKNSLSGTQVADMLPIGTMDMIGPNGEVVQPIVYDRLIVANKRSRLQGLGDRIRGDLPIVPCNKGWFSVSARPNIDLTQGALLALGGAANETAIQTYKLMNASSGNTLSTFAGVNLDMTTKREMGLSSASGDVSVSAF